MEKQNNRILLLYCIHIYIITISINYVYIYIYIHILGRMFTCLSCCGVLVNFMGISNMLNSVGMMKPATNDGFHKEPLCSVATRVG